MRGKNAIRLGAAIVLFSGAFPGADSQEAGGFRYAPEVLPIAGAAHSKLLPSDEKIGELEDLTTLSGEELRVLERARQFGNALSEGRIDESVLEPESRWALAYALRSRLEGSDSGEERSIDRLRYAAVDIDRKLSAEKRPSGEEASARVRVRLISNESSAAGELLFVKTGERWYIAMVDVDFKTVYKEQGEKNGTDGR